MKARNWKGIAELVGIAAIVATLVFVGMQMRQEQEIATADIFQDERTVNLAQAELLADNRVVLAKANRGDQLSQEDMIALDGIVFALSANAYVSYRRWSVLDHPAANGMARGLAVYLHRNPGLIPIWRDYYRSDPFRPSSHPVSEFSEEVEMYLRDLSGE